MKKKISSFIFYGIAVLFLILYFIADRSATLNFTEFGRLFLLCGSCLFLYFGGLQLSKYKNNTKPMKINLWIFFGLYLVLLITLTLFDSMWGRNVGNLINTNIDYKQYFENTVNLIPFKTIIGYVTEFDSMYSTSSILFNLLGNLVALMPMAFFLPLLFLPDHITDIRHHPVAGQHHALFQAAAALGGFFPGADFVFVYIVFVPHRYR